MRDAHYMYHNAPPPPPKKKPKNSNNNNKQSENKNNPTTNKITATNRQVIKFVMKIRNSEHEAE